MWIDERNEFADAVALNTGAPGLYLLGDVIDLQSLNSAGTDLGAAGQDLGGGNGGHSTIYAVITVDTAATGTGTVRFKVVSDSLAAIATDGTATEHVTSQDFDVDVDLVAGARIVMPLPAEIPVYERFLGIIQETIGAAVTAGAINAFLTRDIGSWKSYPDAQN